MFGSVGNSKCARRHATNDVSVPACQNDGSTRGIQIQAGNFLEISGELFIFSNTKGVNLCLGVKHGPVVGFLQNSIPIGSMYAIYGNIYHQYTPNVSIYTIHGSYGIWNHWLTSHLSKKNGFLGFAASWHPHFRAYSGCLLFVSAFSPPIISCLMYKDIWYTVYLQYTQGHHLAILGGPLEFLIFSCHFLKAVLLCDRYQRCFMSDTSFTSKSDAQDQRPSGG